ncbi:hypothetical protein TPL01_12710 [Sulfuriferula plumbiphila]|uniref:Uncharacterized protein n=1 Tax=Sulfuriferula plumbiphila TaxID=171865 RepID=A0A512L6M2_9PROT|nr:hypothetical protein SFPGR_22820 [Sulfuriferula plumbiphila]GEP30133.1 hypothetical protein TPL01_12710 [Sulfuriferula plumbiphila]
MYKTIIKIRVDGQIVCQQGCVNLGNIIFLLFWGYLPYPGSRQQCNHQQHADTGKPMLGKP